MSAADFMLVLTIGLGVCLLVGFFVVAGREKTGGGHPEGRRGRLRDEALSASPNLPFVGVMLSGIVFDSFRDSDAYLWLLGGAVLLILAQYWLPPVKAARKRLDGIAGYPPQ